MTAHLEVLTAKACTAATGSQEGQAFLEYLDAHNPFVTPLDDEYGAYAYHPLFAEFLRR
jgi:ATP/maltotriose-dependent transcriptional regulator MalT